MISRPEIGEENPFDDSMRSIARRTRLTVGIIIAIGFLVVAGKVVKGYFSKNQSVGSEVTDRPSE
ncbi:MAG: hypothetical protein V1908_02415 [Candidatus Peregrinibacteria bacterium]